MILKRQNTRVKNDRLQEKIHHLNNLLPLVWKDLGLRLHLLLHFSDFRRKRSNLQ